MLRRFAFAALFAAACSSGSAHAPDGGTADFDLAVAGGVTDDGGAAELGAGDLALSPWKLTWSDEFNGPAGPPDGTTQFPQTTKVDYVRVYEQAF